MATGPGPGSHLIGGAHVRLTIDDRQYYQRLNQARQQLQQFAAGVGPINVPGINRSVNQINAVLMRAARDAERVMREALRDSLRGAAATLRSQRSAEQSLARAARDAQRTMDVALRDSLRDAARVAALAAKSQRNADQSLAKAARDAQKAIDVALRDSLRDAARVAATTVRSQKQIDRDLSQAARDAQKAIDIALRDSLRDAAAKVRAQQQADQGLAQAARDAQRAMDVTLRDSLRGAAAQVRAQRQADRDAARAAKIAASMPPPSPGESLAAGGQDFLRRVAGAFRRANQSFLGWGTRTSQWFLDLSREVAAFHLDPSLSPRIGNLFDRMGTALRGHFGIYRTISNTVLLSLPAISSFLQGTSNLIGITTDHLNRAGTLFAAGIRRVSFVFGGLSGVFNKFISGFSTVASTSVQVVSSFTKFMISNVSSIASLFTVPIKLGWNLFASSLKTVGQFIGKSIGSVLGQVGKLGVLAGGIGAAFSLVYITNQIVKMEHELTRLRRTTGASAQEIQALAASFNNMGTTLAGVDLNKIIELATMGARLGVPREQLNLFTRDLAKVAAVLEDIPIDEATQRFSGLIDVFQLAYTDTIRLASSLNALDIASNASGRDILDIAGRMSGAASTIGLTVQQTLALATAMRQARVPIETAGTAMSQILGRMTSKDMPAFARVAGMGGMAFRNLLQRDALQALVAVEQGLGRLGGIERFRALDELHLDGQRVRLVMLQLVPVLGRLNQYLGIANDEWETTASIMNGFEMQANTASAMFKRMWNNVQLLAVSLGTFLLPIIKGFADGISNLSADIRSFIEGNGAKLKTWGEAVGKAIEAAGATFRVLTRNWADVRQIMGIELSDIWSQFKDNAWIAFGNIVNIGANAIDQLAQYIIKVLPQALINVASLSLAGWAQVLPGPLGRWIMGGQANLNQAQNIAQNLPALQPAGNFFNVANLTKGVGPLPGIQGAGMMGMIAGLFGGHAADQRKERLKREADAQFEDWLTRMFAPKGKRAAAGGGPLAAMAAMVDQAEGGAGGGVGGAGGVDPMAMAMAGIAGRRRIPAPPQGPRNLFDVVNAGLEGMLAVPMANMGFPGINTPGIPIAAGMAMGNQIGPLMARARHNALLAWRARMAARRGQGRQAAPGIVNPWIAIRNQLAERRQAMWMALRGGGPPRDRRDVMRRVAEEQHRQQEIRNRRVLGQGGAPEWAANGIAQIVRELQGIKQAVGIPVFGD